MAQNDRTPEQSPQKPPNPTEAPPREVDDFLDRADKARKKQQERNEPLGKKILGLLKKLSEPEVPPAEPIMEAMVGVDEVDPLPLPNEPGLNVLRTDTSLPDGARQEQRNQKVADMMARTNENITQAGINLDDQRVEAQQPKVTRVPGEQSLVGNVVRGITSPDQLLPQHKLPEAGTSDFIKGLEKAAEEGRQLGQQEARQRELDDMRAQQEAEAERVRLDAEIREKIQKAGFKIPGLPENATEDEKRAARTAYVRQMMADTQAGIDQAAWQRRQETVPVKLQGQPDRDEEGIVINPYKEAEAEPTPPPPKLGPIDAARASRESWENGQRTEPGIDIPYIKSRAEQAALFGFDVADPTEWERGKAEMKAFQKAMEYGIKHLDGIISTPREPKEEKKKLDIVMWGKKGLFQNDFYRRYHVGHQGVSVIDAVRDGISNDLFRTGRPEWADPEVRKQMALAIENQVRIKKLQHDILMMKGEIAAQEQLALREKPDSNKGFRPVVERNKPILEAMRGELSAEEAKTAAIAAELAKARAKAQEERISVEVPVRDARGNADGTRRVARVIDAREGAVTINPVTGEVNLPQRPDFVPEAPKSGPEIQTAPVMETKEAEPQPLGEIVSAGESNRGGRKDGPDEDAVFSGGGLHLGEIGGTKDTIVSDKLERAKGLAAILNELNKPGTNPPEKFTETGESIQNLWNKIDQLKKEGKLGGLDIVIDGMGGNAVGEVGSSLAMFAILENISTIAAQQNAVLNGETVRNAVIKANELLIAHNTRTGENTGATIVMALTSPDGKTAIAQVGDARAYKIKSDGSVAMLTKDQSLVFRLAGMAEGVLPSDYLKHPQRNGIYGQLGEVMDPSRINVYEGDDIDLKNGDRLILGCDALWESAASERGELTPEAKTILGEIDASYTLHKATQNKTNEDLQMEAQAEIFKRIILAGHENDTPEQLAKHLTREQAGAIAHDNISAVVVERKAPSESETSAPNAAEENPPRSTTPGNESKPTDESDAGFLDVSKVTEGGLWYILQEVVELVGEDQIPASMQGALESDFKRLVLPTLWEITSKQKDKRMAEAPRLGNLIEASLAKTNVTVPQSEISRIAIKLIQDIDMGRLHLSEMKPEDQQEDTQTDKNNEPDAKQNTQDSNGEEEATADDGTNQQESAQSVMDLDETEEPAVAAATAEGASDTEKTTAEERAEAITPELVEAKCVIVAAGTIQTMATSGEKIGNINERYLNLLRKNVRSAESGNKPFDKAAGDVADLQRALKELNVESVKTRTQAFLAELRDATDPAVQQQKATEVKGLIDNVQKVIIARIARLREAREQVSMQASETPINQDQFDEPGMPKTIREQVEKYNQLATAEEQKLIDTLEEQKKAADKAIDDLVNLDATVEAEKQAAREDDTLTPESIAAEEARVLAELQRVVGKDGTKNVEEKAAIVKTLMDLFKNSKVKAPLFMAAIVVVGISGLLTSGAAAKRGRF